MGLRRFFRRSRWDAERARELEDYLAHEIDDNLARGMTPGEARAAAQRKLGNRTRIREEIYDLNSIRWFETIRLDGRDAWRQLRRRPISTLVTGGLLAIGIGASAAGFAVAYGTLMRPLPFPAADRLATIWQETAGRREQVTAPDYRDLRTMPAVEEAALLASGAQTVMAGGIVARTTGVLSEPSLLALLGARAALGRLLTPADTDKSVAVISHRLWAGMFHGRPDVVGGTMTIGGRPWTIAGVLENGFPFELPVGGAASGIAFTVRDVDLWMPLGPGSGLPDSRQVYMYEAIVRLRPGVRLEQAQGQADAIAATLSRQYPDSNRGRGFRVVPLAQQVLGERASAIRIGFAGALLMLIIACANAASLGIGELPARRRDFALREALGAGRMRLMRQAALESLLLAIGAAVCGLGLARLLLDAFVASLELPRLQDVRFDGPVALFGTVLAFVAALIARLAPMAALEGGAGGLRASSATHAASAPRLRRALVAMQLAMALVVCLTAGLIGASLRAVLLIDPGFATAHVLSARVSAFSGPFPDKPSTVRFFASLVASLREAPGVTRAAAGSSLPLSGSSTGTSVMAEGQPVAPSERPTAGWQIVTPGYFAAVGIPLRLGRDFTPEDATRATHHVVVNQALAHLLFGSQNPVGRRLSLGGGGESGDWHEIVGVVGDVRHANLTDPPSPRAYDLSGEHWARTMFVVVRGDADPASLAPVLRRAVATLDPGAPVFDVRALDDLLGAASAQRRVAAIFTAGVGAVTLLLAALGVYGLLASSVAARTRELGVRRALGSSSLRIVGLVAKEALQMSALGIAAGVAVAVAAARVIQAQLYGVAATDPRAIGAVAALLILIAAASALAPALRAARVDPVTALKSE